MSERRRLEHGRQFDYFVCDVHGWDFDESDVDDVCPVCRGEQMERERIIALLEGAEREANIAKPITGGSYGYWEGLNKAIALIKGENSE